jgi:hypothetical protein
MRSVSAYQLPATDPSNGWRQIIARIPDASGRIARQKQKQRAVVEIDGPPLIFLK